ncbi:alpha-hydroxy-acid oxidizing protein [Leptospira sp. 2 VSF19]|uniref:Alpha-hydroxy-acid oxidizing protein n=1 Tax=Leptospira soteropolitanensis TaxID=2950025 RepID=A0AAW5V9M1_9LEPT|nr:alpha-hydroxy-acid oxidizing protein [Leptospira soteropolitanensis]MCW7492917.1 alpha-hydroxy-acid oxidizing protein [Leptospira soteropolitanensis]MCW7500152.1 alpha-hydroxy-acid oxidizing protein [Leptospira soteropolitanensis]MCW7522403.1 alpha-hydroxy-acid oxidizing protein [Leptospira soteropolitanensis]MCW7526259.1 alpha-hydroxy-acid oxidizing protein [Leptospira soteropolitanensis]MCW7529629.1 alpha-hydroxy-acid oxidizing protein [Leptospira soteropolitanensis]
MKSVEGKTILIIGGGLLQVPIIQTAKTMRLHTVVADMNPSSIGFQIADEAIVMSTKDVEGMVRESKKFAQNSPIHGVITAGTDASMTVAAVASALQLPGIRFVDAEAASNKVKMRQRLKEFGMPIPRFAAVWSLQDAKDALDSLTFPLVMKPADNMGARGVIKVNHKDDLPTAFRHAKRFCPTGELILEEYMEGPELSVDALAFQGQIRMTGIADRIIEREPYFIEVGHNMPSAMSKEVLDEVERVMAGGMRALGIHLGAGKGDIKVTKEGVKIGEIAARLSGGFMSAFTYPLSTGVNLNRAALLISLGETPDNLDPVLSRVSIERSLLSKPGKLLSIGGVEETKKIDGVSEVFIQSKPGDIIKEPTNNIDKSGHVIIVADTLKDAETVFEKVKQTIRFEVDEQFSITEKEINDQARIRFGKDICWVCKQCDGSNCASGIPGMGGVGRMETFHDNSVALSEYSILPGYIRDHVFPEIQTKFLGYDLKTPIMAAPMTGVGTNMNFVMTDADYANLVVRSFVQNGSLAWLGDGASPEKYKIMLDALKKSSGKGILICKPREDESMLVDRFSEAEADGVFALGMDIDAVNFKTMIQKNLSSITRPLDRLIRLKEKTKLPFILKGIMNPEDAKLAVEGGFSAIVVSNHGGRVLDGMPGTARVLPKIAEVVKGKIPLLVDGGIRSGMDVFKMLALGADAILLGRPVAISLVGGEDAGIRFLLQKYSEELKQSMSVTGAKTLVDIKRTMLLHKLHG